MIKIFPWCLTAFILISTGLMASSDGLLRKTPNVAGQFYSADPQQLSKDIDAFKSKSPSIKMNGRVRMLMVPHAGYEFSGAIAGAGYQAVASQVVKTVIVVAPSHFTDLTGVSIWPSGSFQTPLGDIAVDEDLAQKLLKADPRFANLPKIFDREHALEVQLPFIEKTWPHARLVPVIIGQPEPSICRALAEALMRLTANRDDVLIVLSTDLSHYHDYQTAKQMDALTIEAVLNKDAKSLWEGVFSRRMELCGFTPVIAGLVIAQELSLKTQLIVKANSGDVTGDKSRVVGYAAIAFYEDQENFQVAAAALTDQQRQSLLALARRTVESFVAKKDLPDIKTEDLRLRQVQGAFVTLQKHGVLRGCIGNIIGQKPLIETVRDMAKAAASQDPRFNPVEASELKDIDVEVSVLSVPVRISSPDEIILGTHGVIVSDGASHQGVFLPQVATETGWSKEEFLSELCSQKAGLEKNCWQDPHNVMYAFTADVIKEGHDDKH